MRELLCKKGVPESDWNARMALVTRWFTSRGFFLSLKDYDEAWNVSGSSRTDECVLYEQSTYAS